MNRGGAGGLSKSLILMGLQCPKALYLSRNPPDIVLPPRPDREALYRRGTEVGILAQELFPGGVEVPYAGLSVAEQTRRTAQLIADGSLVIYEASFLHDGIFVKVDILRRDGTAWEIREVKMGTSVKEVNLVDVAVQYHVLVNCGLDVSRAFLIHVDNSYVRSGPIEVDRLFAGKEITREVLDLQDELPPLIAKLRQVLSSKGEPRIDIGEQCTEPYECDYIPYCWRHVPENSVFSLSGRKAEKFALYREGFLHLSEVPLDRLKPRQRFEAEVALEQRQTADPEALRVFLDTLWHPLCHLDFETVDTPIPPFDGTRPYQKIPFQYSLHVQSEPGADPVHFEYLPEPDGDPRRKLAQKLLAEIPEGACILTYNQSFEKGVLRDLAAAFSDLADPIERRLACVRDLMTPFKKRHVYHWAMRGSSSIKKVLPALVPELSYEGLNIGEGGLAMLAYREMAETDDAKRAQQIRRDLLEYCRLDTLAMVKILERLRSLARAS